MYFKFIFDNLVISLTSGQSGLGIYLEQHTWCLVSFMLILILKLPTC